MKYRMIVTTLALALIASITALGADKPAKGEGKPHGFGLLPPPMVEKLTADQKAKYDTILADYQKDAKAARDAGDKEKGMTIRKAAFEKVQEILTDDQKAELKKMREAHGGKPGGGHGKKPEGAPKQ